MINLILTLSLSAVNPQPAQTAQYKPCVWPNVCKSAPVVEILPAEQVAQFTTCVWPRKCNRAS